MTVAPDPLTAPEDRPQQQPKPSLFKAKSPALSPDRTAKTMASQQEPAINLRVASHNCQGFSTADKVSLVLNDADAFHIFLLQETNLLPLTDGGSRINHLDIPAAWTLAAPGKAVTPTNRGKGLAILAHPSLTASCPTSAEPIPIMKPVHEVICDSFELLAVQITNIIVVNIYIHASTQPDYGALKDAIEGIPGFREANVLVAGDFNHPSRRRILEHDVMAALGLAPAYDPDHPIATRGCNPLDLMFWKGSLIQVSDMVASAGSTSDHLIISTEVSGTTVASLVAPCAPPSMILWDDLPDVPYDLLSAADKLRYHDLVEECVRTLASACTSDDPLSAMTDGLLASAAIHLGTKQYRIKKRNPWWNKHLAKLHKQVRRAHKRTLRTDNIPDSRRQRYADEYKTILAKYKNTCSKARRQCLESFQAKFKPTDMNRTWHATAYHRGKRHPKYMRRTAADPDKTCEYWQGIFSEPRFERPPTPEANAAYQQTFQVEDIKRAIQDMSDTTPGEDGLRTRLLTFLRDDPDAIGSISRGLNRACALTISDRAKTSITVLIKKPRAPGSDPGSYRPIALQPVMTKLLSKCVEHKILEQVKEGSVHLSDSQGAFRAERSRYDLILLLRCAQEHYRARARTSVNRADCRVFAAFLDIKKAYDSVPHAKIVERLRHAGVREDLIRIVADMLTHRTTVIYGNTVHIGRGVPQGDPLSPLLFILMMQPLSDALAQHPYGGVKLPGDLSIKDLLYADDIALLAETAEDLNSMLQVCQEWANETGFVFSVDKSKVMVLTGANPADLPPIAMYGEPLEWVKVFQYLGFPIFANNKPHKHLPLDLKSVFQVVGPMASILYPGSAPDLPLIQRTQAFYTMVEGKAMHNAQVADLDIKNIDSYVNKGLKRVSGLLDSTQLRCDLGILPAELVVHRNAMYYLWHLRRQVWFRQYLPALADLQPIKRLTSMVLAYRDLCLRDIDHMEYDQWRTAVKKAILDRSRTYYSTDGYADYCLYPEEEYGFKYRGQDYLNNLYTTNLGQTAIVLRHDRLCGVPQPWEHHPCVYCGQPAGLQGRHLLQCASLPANLIEDRRKLIEAFYPDLSLANFARATVACAGAHLDDSAHTLLLFLRRSLALGRKIIRHARKTAREALQDEAESEAPQLDLSQLFREALDDREAEGTSMPICSLQGLMA